MSQSAFRRAGMMFMAVWLSLSSATFSRDTALPVGMTAEQYQTLIDDIADAVVKKLEAAMNIDLDTGRGARTRRINSYPFIVDIAMRTARRRG